MDNKKILIVDDDRDFTALIRNALEAEGYETAVAHDGREALHILTGHQFEPCVVLLDLNMPVMDGWQMLAVMRSYTGLRTVPVVLISGQAVEREARPVFEALLQKPFTIEQLVETVARVCAAGPRD